jgi:hypothetical protein
MIAQALFKSIAWALRKVGFRALVSLFFLAILLESVVAGVRGVVTSLGGSALGLTTFLALLLGWLTAKSRLKGWQAGLLLATSGFIIIIVDTLALSAKLIALARAAYDLIGPIVYWQWGHPLPGTGLLAALAGDLGWAIWQHLVGAATWAARLITGRASYDPAAAAFTWGLFMWGAAAWAAWAFRRRQQPFEAVLPAAVVLAASFSFARASIFLFIPFLSCLIMLLGWNNLLRQEKTWLQRSLDYAEDLHLDTGMLVGGIAVLVTFGAMAVSNLSPQKALEFVQNLGEQRSAETTQFGQALGLVSNPGQPGSPDFGMLPRQHLLGSSPELSERLVMLVRTDWPVILPANRPAEPAPAPLYWRSLTYDIYTGYGWKTSPVSAVAYPANQPVNRVSAQNQLTLQQNIQPVGNLGAQLHYVGSFSTANLEYQAEWRSVEENDPRRLAALEMPDGQDLFSVIGKDRPPEANYIVNSFLPRVSEAQLRTTGSDYPTWIRERYLALPERLPGRVRDLAATITAGASTPYDKALAIESFLRTYPYTLEVAAPPQGQDVADYFLFSVKQGYCDYFATSMVVLARAVGLPARLVLGYASGSYIPETGQYLVTEADAHSWVEVYFPGTGWVEFEPTSGRPAVERPKELPPVEIPEIASPPTVPPAIRDDWLSWLIWPILLAGMLGLGLFFLTTLDALWLRRNASDHTVQMLYLRLRRQGRLLKITSTRAETPNEFSQRLAVRLRSLSQIQRWRAFMQSAAPDSKILSDLYAQSIYSARLPTRQEQEQAIWTWQRLRKRLWLARFQALFKFKH